MDTRTLLSLLKARPTLRCLQITLKRLEGSGLITRGNLKVAGAPAHYWMIDINEESRARVLARTGIRESQLRSKNPHWSQYPHESICTIFHASIERQMPGLWVLREGTKNFKDLPDHLVSERVKENGYTPDLCLGIPLDKAKAYRWVAVEIDRCHRSHKRIAARANIYSRHTAFAGLLYFMPNEHNRENLAKIYASRGAKDSLRISGGSDTFLATAVMSQSLFDVNSLIVKCAAHELALSTWLAFFALCEHRQRDANLMRIVSQGATLNGAPIESLTV